MIWLLLPVAAVVFAFLISVLSDLRTSHKMDFQKLTSHGTRLAMYLSSIGMLEVLRLSKPEYASFVSTIATSFAVIEILTAFATMKESLGPNDPGVKALEDGLQQVEQDPFAVTKQNQGK